MNVRRFSIGIIALLVVAATQFTLQPLIAQEPTTAAVATPSLTIVEPKQITFHDDVRYREGDSNAWTLDIAVPENFGGEKHPALVIIHGGGWRAGSKRDRPYRAMLSEFALKGYVTLSVEYRLTGEAPMPACIEDVKCAIRWLRAHADQYKVDPDRIAAYGHSAGAHLVLMLAMTPHVAEFEGDGPWKEHSSAITSAIGGSTPTVVGQRFSENGPKYSPITYVKNELPPMLLIHGTDDTTVRVDTADAFVDKLKEVGFEDITYVKIENANHGVAYEHYMEPSMRAMNEFLERTLTVE